MTDAPRLVHITPEPEFNIYHSWLSSKEENGGMDKVHEITGRDELVKCRLGKENSSKKCYALVNEDGGLLSVIYTHWAAVPTEDETWKMLPKRVDAILAEPSTALEAPPNVASFYSISSFALGTGKPLISSIYDAFTQAANPPILTTISPLRTFQAWLNQEGTVLSGTDDAKCHMVAKYLQTRKDPVQKFHLSNGAQIGAIQLNANAEGTKDVVQGAGVMINYRYPRNRARLEENISILRQERIPASYHLQPFFAK